ncbi:MAG: GNAT family N-acetyltransferase [Pseudomonadota bacterium]
MTSRVKILDLTADHLPEMIKLRMSTERLHRRLLPRIFHGRRTEAETEANLRRYLGLVDDKEPRNRFAIGCTDAGTLRGYALYSLFDWPQDDTMNARRGIYVRDIAVAESHLRQSIGSSLLQELRRRAEASGLPAELHATIWEGNDASKALFKKAGFVPLNTSYALYLDQAGASDGA